MTNILLLIIVIELFFVWAHVWGINKNTYKFRPSMPPKDWFKVQDLSRMKYDPQSDEAKHGCFERRGTK